jgi:hypothetical protein
MQLIGYVFPILFWLAIDAGIVLWALQHLDGDKSSVWAIVGLLWVAITVPATIIHYGTTEIRHFLHKIVQPGWDRYEPSMNPDLHALNRAVNGYRNGHINLRLVRQQLIKLQNTEIKMPVQLFTLIDRSIACCATHRTGK